jgi:hypothetical protein
LSYAYLDAVPDLQELHKPAAFAGYIDLMLNAYALTGDARYRARAGAFGRQGLRLFLDEGASLPRATNRHDHYESITGGPDFMRALLRLHEAETGSG